MCSILYRTSILNAWFIALPFLVSLPVKGQIIPFTRRVEWKPGVPGEIPHITFAVENITDHGGYPGGTVSSKAFYDALDALPEEGGVIYFPEGKYRFTAGIEIIRSNIVLRGAGMNKTRLVFDTGDICISVGISRDGDWQNLLEGYRKDTKTVTVDDGSKFDTGGFAEIQQKNDPDIMYTDPFWDQSWSKHSVGQIFEIDTVAGDQVTFTTPLYISYRRDLHPQISPRRLIERVGIEDLYIEKLQSGNTHTILFDHAAYCWVRNIESYHTDRSHVSFHSCLGCEVRHSYFHHSLCHEGGHGYGVSCIKHSSNILVEDNIFYALRSDLTIATGTNGSVFSYNYMGEDISVHGHYSYMNLYEDNYVDEIGIADWWGPAGPGNTYFRNRVFGVGIFYRDQSHQQNVLGNITTYLYDDDGTSQEKLEHGNVVAGRTQWHDTIPDHTLPDSYYLEGKPEFFRDFEWPVCGPDVEKPLKIPARYRFEQLMRKREGFFTDQWQPKSIAIPSYNNIVPPVVSETVTVYVDPRDILSGISPFSSGHDLNYSLAKYYFIPELQMNMKDLDPGILRYPGGNEANRFFWNRDSVDGIPDDADISSAVYGLSSDPEYLSIDHNYVLRDTLGATGLNTVNYAYARYGTGEDPVGTAAHHAAEWVRYDNGRTLYWEIGSENYAEWNEGYRIDTANNQDGQPVTINGELYGKHFKVFVDSMKKAARETGVEIHIGAVAFHAAHGDTPVLDTWNGEVFEQVGDVADFITLHKYFGKGENADSTTILETVSDAIQPKEVVSRQLVEHGFEPLPVALSGWKNNDEGQRQSVTCLNGLHACLTIQQIIEARYGAALQNVDRAEEVIADNEPGAPFYYMYYFNRFLGDRMVRTVVDGSENINAFATTFASGHTSLILSNTGDTSVTATVAICNVNAGPRYYCYTLTGDSTIMSRKVNINGHTTTSKAGGPENYDRLKARSAFIDNREIRLDLPPYSANFILIEGTDSLPRHQVFFQLYLRDSSGSVLPADKARIEFGRYVCYTDQNGKTGHLSLPGEYCWEAGKQPGYPIQSGYVHLQSDTTITDTLEYAAHNVTICVTDGCDQHPLAGCTITLDRREAMTDSAGSATLHGVDHGYYALEITLQHYQSLRMGPFLISSDTTLRVTMETRNYQVRFVVTDQYNGKEIGGVDLAIGDLHTQTDWKGRANLILVFGHYSITLQRDDYDTICRDFYLLSDTTFRYAMNKKLATVTFKISSNQRPVKDASVTFDQQTAFTNLLGMVSFEKIMRDQHVPYSVSKSGYQRIRDTLKVHHDTAVNLELHRPLVDINSGKKSNVRIYPNPAHNRIFIVSDQICEKFMLLDINHKSILVKRPRSASFSVNLVHVKEGLYIIEMELQDDRHQKYKVIKTK